MKYLIALILSVFLTACPSVDQRAQAKKLAVDFLQQTAKAGAVAAADAGLTLARAKLAEAQTKLAEAKATTAPDDATGQAKIRMLEQTARTAENALTTAAAAIAKLYPPEIPVADGTSTK
mgnify:CR=1 FL=1